MNKQDKIQNILDNYINGNISDCKEAIKKLPKIELLDLIQEWNIYCNEDYYNIIIRIQWYLNH